MRILLLTLLFFMSSASIAAQKAIRLPTAADGEIEVLVDTDTKLPLGASDGKAKVTEAALAFLPKKAGEPLQLTWRYSIQFDPSVKVQSITIEDEKGEVLRPLIKDEAPSLTDGSWQGQEIPAQLTKEIFEAMNSKELWIILRRITVVYSDGQSSKLHQLVLQPPSTRRNLIDEVMRQMKGDTK